jgi:hypothetical protein
VISIIICSIKSYIDPDLDSNIKTTVGVPYELIFINNEKNKYSIFEAFNIGVSKSNFEICCFMHDDIKFHSNNWGVQVVNTFSYTDASALAVAGTTYLRKMPAYWPSEYNVVNLIQSSSKNNQFDSVHWNTNDTFKQILAFDGLWFCIKKILFNKIMFDSNAYKGFHFYDLDISLQIYFSGYKTYFIPNILIEHTSLGSINYDWMKNSIVFYYKWKKLLPINEFVSQSKTTDMMEDVAIISFFKKIHSLKSYDLFFSALKIGTEIKGGFAKFVIFLVLYLWKKLKTKAL